MKKITNAIIFVVIGVILAVGVMTPIMAGMSSQVVTEKNNISNTYKMASYTQENIIENIEGVPYINGTSLDDMDTSGNIRIVTDKFILESLFTTATQQYGAWYIRNMELTTTVSTWDKIVFKQGTLTIYSSTETVLTDSYDTLLMPSKKGDYTVAIQNTFYINDDQTLYVIGSSGTNTVTTLYKGTLENMAVIASSLQDPTTASINITSSQIQEETGLYKVTNITVSENNKIVFIPTTYKEITSDNVTVKTIIMLLPILIAVMLIIAVVYNVIDMKRNEL